MVVALSGATKHVFAALPADIMGVVSFGILSSLIPRLSLFGSGLCIATADAWV